MDTVKLCRLCLNIIQDDDFVLVENYIHQILENLFMNVNLGICSDPIVCKGCTASLQYFYDFKAKCLSSENISLKDTKEDWKDVSLGENEEPVVNGTLGNKKICRFCTNVAKIEFTQLNDIMEYIPIVFMLQKHIPELNLHATETVISCKTCFDLLQSFHCFITKCTDVEEKISKHAHSEGADVSNYIQLSKVAEITCNDDAVREVNSHHELKKGINCIEIKSENLAEQNVNIKTEQIYLKTEILDSDSHDTPDSSEGAMHIYKCEQCSFLTTLKWSLIHHCKIHQSPSEVMAYECKVCPYSTKYKYQLKQHLLSLKHASEEKTFICQLCTYTANDQIDLKCHLSNHQRMYKCDVCSYVAKIKTHLDGHMLVHKNPSEITMYKCDECTFVTKYERCLRRHRIIHKNPAEVGRIFKCDLCAFEATKLSNLKRHVIVHRSRSEITLYECHKCSFKTRHEDYLTNHMKLHKEAADVTIYKCDLCWYEATKLSSLKRHMISHKSVSEKTLFECDKCSYKTARKDNLKKHLIVHKDSSEITLYKCYNCQYITRYKKSLKRHMLTHC